MRRIIWWGLSVTLEAMATLLPLDAPWERWLCHGRSDTSHQCQDGLINGENQQVLWSLPKWCICLLQGKCVPVATDKRESSQRESELRQRHEMKPHKVGNPPLSIHFLFQRWTGYKRMRSHQAPSRWKDPCCKWIFWHLNELLLIVYCASRLCDSPDMGHRWMGKGQGKKDAWKN